MTSFSFHITALVSCVLVFAPSVLSNVVCPDDPHATMCVMCKQSDLGQRWAKYTAEVTKCASVTNKLQRTQCYCTNYSQLSYAWSRGVCCSEYAPMLAVTTNLCNLQTYPEDQITDSHLDYAVSEAKRVQDTIWHNDSGWDIPKASVFIQPHAGGSITTYANTAAQTDSPLLSHVSYKSETPTSPQKSHPADNKPAAVKPQPKDEYTKPQPKDEYTKPKDEHTKSSLLTSKVEVHQVYSTDHSAESKKQPDSKKTSTSDTVHHHAKTVDKCHGKPSGCCETNRQKYHRSRTTHRTNIQKLSKRDGNTTFNPRVTTHKLSKRGGCGKAFNGVEYPLSVPDSVLKMYKMI